MYCNFGCYGTTKLSEIVESGSEEELYLELLLHQDVKVKVTGGGEN